MHTPSNDATPKSLSNQTRFYIKISRPKWGLDLVETVLPGYPLGSNRMVRLAQPIRSEVLRDGGFVLSTAFFAKALRFQGCNLWASDLVLYTKYNGTVYESGE